MEAGIRWNDKVKLIVSDVDETVADVYREAAPEMITELSNLLQENKAIFFITGASLVRVRQRIIDKIPPSLRKKILIAHCSGAEVWGFDQNGLLNEKPFFSTYEETFSPEQKTKWRVIVKQLITEFQFHPHEAGPVKEFKTTYCQPLDIMLEDRGPQITLELVNAYNLPEDEANKIATQLEIAFPRTETDSIFDLRIPVMNRVKQLCDEANLPVDPHLGGIFALDMTVKDVSKTSAIKYVMENDAILSALGFSKDQLNDPETIEIWGDKFTAKKGGLDLHMALAFPKEVRSIDFRDEPSEELPRDYNIQLWPGKHKLYDGLLEYLQSR